MGYTLHHLLVRNADHSPEKMAVFARGASLSYEELERRSNQLAHLLRERGVNDGDRIGLYLSKSLESVVAMLGTLKAGAAYVPIDPRAPSKRVEYILQDCSVSGIVVDGPRLEALPPEVRSRLPIRLGTGISNVTDEPDGVIPWAALDAFPSEAPPERPVVETDLAYILYTSGSTGQPKGVVLTHRNALTFVNWCAETFGVRADDRLSNHAPLHFDLSVFDIYNAIHAGAAVYLIHDEVGAFPSDLASFMETHRLTIWYSVPSALIYLLVHGRLAGRNLEALRVILFAGEVFPMKYLRELADAVPKAEMYNLYGPTETNVCTYYRVDRPRLSAMERLPIGFACANTEVFALAENGERTRIGEVGELYVRGPSVTPGYWGDAAKTRKGVVQNPLRPHFAENVYRTGDLVIRDSDGAYDFVGRRDSMIKSRGYRIELGEIEAALYTHSGVKEAVVVAIPDDQVGNRLKAVVVPHQPGSLTPAELEKHCAQRIPSYMIPEWIEFLEALPKTSSGKTDRVRLAEAGPKVGG